MKETQLAVLNGEHAKEEIMWEGGRRWRLGTSADCGRSILKIKGCTQSLPKASQQTPTFRVAREP
ncbi:hypothetical protein SK128_010665, partial [Halocaridina rubra]